MTLQLAEVGKKVSAANQEKIRTVVESLMALLDAQESETTETEAVESREAVLEIGPVATLADVKKAMNRLIAYIPNTTTREQLEGDGDGDGDDEDKDGNEGALLQTAVGLASQAESVRMADFLDKLEESVLSTADRKSLDKSQFAIPEKAPGSGSYPIPDEAHARNALTRSSGKPEESRVRAAVKRKFPGIKLEGDEEKAKESALSEAMKAHAAHAANFKAMAGDTKLSHMMKMHGGSPVSQHSSDHEEAGGSAKTESTEDESKESAEFDFESDFIPLVEKAVSRDGTIQIKMIGTGWGTCGYYGSDLLERDGPKAFPRNTKMYWNHPTELEERQRPERDLRDLAAVTTTDAKFMREGPSGPGLYAVAKPVSEYAPKIEELAPYIGTSILATGRGRQGEAEGKKGQIVESIVKGKSCDFVTEPGAKGEVIQLFESARKRVVQTEEVDYDVDELREAQKRLKETENERDRLQVRILLRDAHDMATEELGKVENLPIPTVRKLAETLSKDPPADEDGELDRPTFRKQIKEAVRKEADYIESIVGSGKVRGMGRSNENWNEDTEETDFSESRSSKGFDEAMAHQFSRLNLSETVAKEAAAGRR